MLPLEIKKVRAVSLGLFVWVTCWNDDCAFLRDETGPADRIHKGRVISFSPRGTSPLPWELVTGAAGRRDLGTSPPTHLDPKRRHVAKFLCREAQGARRRRSICAASFATVRSDCTAALRCAGNSAWSRFRSKTQAQVQDSLRAHFVCHRQGQRSQSSGCLEISAATSAIHINPLPEMFLRRERK